MEIRTSNYGVLSPSDPPLKLRYRETKYPQHDVPIKKKRTGMRPSIGIGVWCLKLVSAAKRRAHHGRCKVPAMLQVSIIRWTLSLTKHWAPHSFVLKFHSVSSPRLAARFPSLNSRDAVWHRPRIGEADNSSHLPCRVPI